MIMIHEKEAVTAMLAHIEQECEKVDTYANYNEMLDECYSFESVGGIFSHMQPSRVLKECDETAYRCGYNDWLDSERDVLIEVNNDHYRAEDVDEAREKFVYELNLELSELEAELTDLEADESPDDANEIEKLQDEIKRKQSAIKACEDHAF